VVSDGVVDALVLDLLEWIGPGARAYDEVLDAWRTSCPRLPVWEEANDRGFVVTVSRPGEGRSVSVTEVGAEHLGRCRPRSKTVVA
jgi:D-3-phosphoglycerate dehydrogenase / 2-oxoglutarate reductase